LTEYGVKVKIDSSAGINITLGCEIVEKTVNHVTLEDATPTVIHMVQ